MKIGIIGLGLIGGSVGLALREPSRTILGYDPNPESQKVALSRGCVDRFATLEEIAQCEVIFVAVPPLHVFDTLDKLTPLVSQDTVITDCTSVKSEIADWASQRNLTNFIPGHPMAGHEKGGAAYASAWMFKSARWILTPIPGNTPANIRKVEELVIAMGAHPVPIDASMHDRHIGVLSHMPHVLAAAAVLMGSELERTDVGAGSWRDQTRVGGVDPDLWTQILMGNRAELSKILTDLTTRLDQFKQLFDANDREGLRALLQETKEAKAKQTPDPKPELQPVRRKKG